MEVTNEMVEKIANLARLHLPESEKDSMRNDLQQMISFVDKLNELDTTGVTPLMHMSENVNITREDKVKGSISTMEALQNSPAANDSFFMVPKVIKK